MRYTKLDVAMGDIPCNEASDLNRIAEIVDDLNTSMCFGELDSFGSEYDQYTVALLRCQNALQAAEIELRSAYLIFAEHEQRIAEHEKRHAEAIERRKADLTVPEPTVLEPHNAQADFAINKSLTSAERVDLFMDALQLDTQADRAKERIAKRESESERPEKCPFCGCEDVSLKRDENEDDTDA